MLDGLASLPVIDDFIPSESQQAFERTMQLVKEMHPGFEVIRDHRLVRGLDYYNGSCFEFKLASCQPSEQLQSMSSELFGEAQNTVLAGGRYDYLAAEFGHPRPLPAVGWAAGVTRLVQILEFVHSKSGKTGAGNSKHTIGIASYLTRDERQEYGHQVMQECLKLKRELLDLYPHLQVQLDLRERHKLKDKLSYLMNSTNTAAKDRCSKVIVLGVQELQDHTVTVKYSNPEEASQN